MAKDRKKVQHIHSSVFDKQPTPQSLELGELAVNANKNGSFISTKNTNNEVVRFSEDATIIDWMERKEVFPYSGSVLSDLTRNKSQLLFGVNQVAASGSPHYSDINGAVDMNGNPINPSQDSGYTDGAGFAVDMDIYVMQGSNPSFSSVTTTCGALLQGTTQIQGLSGSCGSLLDVDVTESHFNSDTFDVEGNNISMVASGDGTDEGVISLLATNSVCEEATNGDATFYGSENTKIGVSCDGNNVSDSTVVNGGTINITSTSGDTNINSESNVCILANADANLYGESNTVVGKSCDGTVGSSTTVVGTTINESGNTINITSAGDTIINAGDEIVMSAVTDVKVDTDILCLNGATKAALYGTTTNIGVNCNSGASATTINISGTTINEGGTNLTQNFTDGTVNITNYDVNGDVICISGATNANFYGDVTNIGIDCNNTTTATTINISGTTINLGGDEFNIDVVNDVCLNSRSATTLYGSYRTNVGVSCDDTATAATTNIRGDKVIVDAGVTNLGLTAKEDILESAENDIFITANNVICETAGADVTIYGVESTNVGVNCSGSSPSTLTTINGETININSPITNFDGDVIVSGSVVVNDGLGAKVCSVYGDVRNENGKCSNLSGSTTTNFTIPNEFSHMKNHKNSDSSHENDYYSFEYPVEVDGTITANRAIYSSDIALKDNIRTVSRNDFNKVKRVNTKSFVFKDDPHRTKTYGVIAQEVEAAGLGELVYTKEDGFKAVDYTAFMMLKLSYLEDFCINLSMQNEELKKKIKDLENKK